jgi:hypothetical protein
MALISTGMILLSGATPAFAATAQSGSGNGYKISPVRTDLTINPGNSQTTDIYIQNVSSAVENLQVLVNDFQADTSETGTPAILLNGQQAPQHSLKQYVAPVPNITVQPGAQKDVKITITIPANATPGGYFGAVRFAPANVNAEKNVTLAASVASLILVKVPGNINEQMSIASFDARVNDKNHTVFTSNKGITATVRFKNSGDLQEEPFGKVILKKGGKQLASYDINNTDPRGNVLPDSIRKFSVPLTKLSSFGKYTLEGNFGYGSNGQLLSAKTTFYVIPVWAILAAIIVVLLIVLAAFGLPRMIRNHDRRVLRKAGRR